jgi:hypothetical protein
MLRPAMAGDNHWRAHVAGICRRLQDCPAASGLRRPEGAALLPPRAPERRFGRQFTPRLLAERPQAWRAAPSRGASSLDGRRLAIHPAPSRLVAGAPRVTNHGQAAGLAAGGRRRVACLARAPHLRCVTPAIRHHATPCGALPPAGAGLPWLVTRAAFGAVTAPGGRSAGRWAGRGPRFGLGASTPPGWPRGRGHRRPLLHGASGDRDGVRSAGAARSPRPPGGVRPAPRAGLNGPRLEPSLGGRPAENNHGG